MTNLSVEGVYSSLKESTKKAVESLFPIKGNVRSLVLTNVTIDDKNLTIDDLDSQYEHRTTGNTWGASIKATLQLVDNASNKVLETKTITMGKLPKTTQRYSYIVKGHERQVDSIFRLSPGAYHGVADNGDIVAKWNMLKGRGAGGFNVKIDRETGVLTVELGRGTKSTGVPLYSICRILGATDEEIAKEWGERVTNVNKGKAQLAKNALSIHRAYERSGSDYKPPSPEEAAAYVKQLFSDSQINPDVAKANLGLPTSSIDYKAMIRTGSRLLGISKGTEKEDDRQSLSVKTIHDVDDFVAESIIKSKWEITRKVLNNIDNKDRDISEILGGANILKRQIEGVFEAAQLPEQTNPLQMVSNHTKTTILGKAFGGISGDNVNLMKDKEINPTHLGLLDPLQTPESSDTGLILHTPLGAKKSGNGLITQAYSTKLKKVVPVSASDMEHAVVAYPDQFTFKQTASGVSATPISEFVTVYDSDRTTSKRAAKDVDYILTSSKGLFSISANLVPFVQNTNGNRAMMASKHQEQAVSLKEREQPLVQTQTDRSGVSFESLIGSMYSHQAPVDGKVVKIDSNAIYIQGSDRKPVKVSIYDQYPLNGSKHVIHAEPSVKVGDTVKKGQLIADTNFTKDGKLSIGTNLRTAYIPYKGYNFEDGVVISESAAKKLTSVHLHEETFTQYPNTLVDLNKWVAYAGAEKATPDRVKKIDKDGVIKVGQKVVPGDILICALFRSDVNKEHQQMTKMFKSNLAMYNERGVYWDHEYGGTVAKVVRAGKEIKVFISTEQGMEPGDKIAGRHGNKGIVTKILPDHEMPKDKDGNPVHVLLSPAGIPSRMNIGQVLETAASKIAKKTGKPYIIENFKPGVDYSQKVLDDLKAHNLSDTDELFDPTSGKSLGQVLTGEQFILKLDHQAEKKVTARSTGITQGGTYTDSGQAGRGSGVPGGGQKVGQLDTYALLAHGATAYMREAATFKSDKNQSEVWKAVMTGAPLPAPKVSTTTLQFQDYLRGMGISMDRKGDTYVLSPMTDKQTEHMAGGKSGEIKMPAKALKAKGGMTEEEKNGLFDTKVTGGLKGEKWSYIGLDRKFPNPTFENGIKSLLGLKDAEFEELVGDKLVGGKSGFSIIEEKLAAINVKKELKASQDALPGLKGSDLNKMYKRVRYLKALDTLDISPVDAYLNKSLPVLPPTLRPIKIGFDGSQIVDDFNYLYLNIGQMNEQVKGMDKATPLSIKQEQYASMYDAIRALKMNGMDQGSGSKARHYTGLMEKMTGKGKQPKQSFFQDKVISKRQDLSGRSVVIPDPELNLDEVGVPKVMAMEMFKPFIVKEMVRTLVATNPLDALMKIKQNDPNAVKALEKVMQDRPVIMKRDPALHKFSIQAFKPKLVEGKSINIHPLVCGGFNADFDGDTLALYVPVSDEAVAEAKEKMMPSKNLFSPTSYGLMPLPSQDAVIGMYLATGWGKKINFVASKEEDVVDPLKANRIQPTDVISYMGKETTAGRLLLHMGVPQAMKPHQKLLYDKEFRMNKGALKNILTEVARNHPEEYAVAADHFKKHGINLAYLEGASVGIKDFHDGKGIRDQVLKPYKKQEDQIRKTVKDPKERDKQIVKLYQKAQGELKSVGTAAYDRRGDNRMYAWASSGAKGNWEQFGQMVMGPLIVQDPAKKEVPVPITTSFGEGLPISQYWASLHGARKGTIDRASGTADPGALTKDLVNTVMGYKITMEDCGTKKGVLLDVKEVDIEGRLLAQEIKLQDNTIVPRNTILSTVEIGRIKNSKINQIVVRSSLHCEARNGICQKCFGLNENRKFHSIGTNIGTIAGHAVGEPVTQMMMRTFHTGGVSTAGAAGLTDYFQAAKDLFNVPKKLKGEAVLSKTTGTVTAIKKRTDGTGGTDVLVENKSHYIPPERLLLPAIKVGSTVKAAEALTDGRPNPHDILEITNSMQKVRNHLTDSITAVYAGDTRRRNVETLIKAMTNITKIEDPGKEDDIIRGQYVPLSEVEHRNKELATKGLPPIKHTPTLKPMNKVPLTAQEDFLARLNYQRLQDTFQEGAAQMWSSDIHGHPIAGIAHGAEFGFKPLDGSKPNLPSTYTAGMQNGFNSPFNQPFKINPI